MYRDFDEEIRKMKIIDAIGDDFREKDYEVRMKMKMERKTIMDDISSIVDNNFHISLSKGFIRAYIPEESSQPIQLPL